MKIKDTEVFYRAINISEVAINGDDRTITFPFSSEEAIAQRTFGKERLAHNQSSVKLERLNRGGPLLVNHDKKNHIGIVERAWIDSEKRKGYVTVRFGKSALAEEILQDVKDKIRVNVSPAYIIHRAAEQPDDVVLVTEWEPLEISIESMPVDTNVGIGRSLEVEPIITESNPNPIIERTIIMAEETKTVDNTVSPEQLQIRGMLALGEALGDIDLAREMIASNKTELEFRTAWLEKKKKVQENVVPPSQLDLSKKERKEYRLTRAIMSRMPDSGVAADFEMECSNEIAKRSDKSPKGFFVPYDIQVQRSDEFVPRDILDAILQKRAIHDVATPSRGGYLVGEDLRSESFIDMLRSKIVIVRLGATFLRGLVGNVAIPKQLTAGVAQWVAEGAPATQTNITFGQVPLSPKTLTANAEYTRLLMLQSTPDVELLVRRDLAAVMARGIDAGAISADGTGNAPTGILSQVGVHGVNVAGSPAVFDKTEAIEMETKVAEVNAEFDNQWFLTNPTVRGVLKNRAELGNTIALPLWKDGNTLIGYNAEVTTLVPANTIIFGAFSQLLIGEWGSLDIMVNPYGVNARAGNVEIYTFQTVDIAVRYAQAFSKCVDFA